jgi:hypothetical protein
VASGWATKIAAEAKAMAPEAGAIVDARSRRDRKARRTNAQTRTAFARWMATLTRCQPKGS